MHHFERVEPFFDYNPRDPQAWEERARWLDHHQGMRADRARLAEALLHFNEEIQNAPQAIEAIHRLRSQETLAVVGGQQAGLFGGPLLVLYKAATLIQLARSASATLNRPVVPVFWIAGEDHDFEEVNHIHYMTGENKVLRLKIDHPTGLKTSVSSTILPGEVFKDAVSQLDNALADSEFKQDLMRRLREHAEQTNTLVGSFARLLSDLFGSYGLVLMDSDHPDLRKVEAPMFKALIEDSEGVNQSVLARMAEVRQAGTRFRWSCRRITPIFLFMMKRNGFCFTMTGMIIRTDAVKGNIAAAGC